MFFCLVQIPACIVGLFFRVIYLLKYPVPVRDSYEYSLLFQSNSIKWELLENNPIPPLTLFLLNLPNSLFYCGFICGGIIVNIVLGVMIIFLFSKMAIAIIQSNIIALGIGLLVATHPTLIHYSCQPIRENSFLFFYSLSVISLITYCKTRSYGHILFGGACAAATCLCRHEGFELILIYCLFILFLSKQFFFTRLQQVAVFFLSFSVSFCTILRIINYPSLFAVKYIESIVQKYII